MNIQKTCNCGNEFITSSDRVAIGRGLYCSKKCMYAYRTMPKRGKGTYNIVKINSGWFEKGFSYNEDGGFRKGKDPWNKGTKGLCIPNSGSFQKGMTPTTWKGDDVGYHALHRWVSNHKGKASMCQHCGSEENVQWANKSHEYKRELDDFIELCAKCHKTYDKDTYGWATKLYPEINSKQKQIHI